MVDDPLLVVQVVDGLGDLEAVVPDLVEGEGVLEEGAQVAVLAVLEDEVEVDFVGECVLEFDDVAVFQGAVDALLVLVEGFVIGVPDHLQTLPYHTLTNDCLLCLLVMWKISPLPLL